RLVGISLLFVLVAISQLWGQSGNKLLDKKQLESDYYYLEFKNYFDKENYFEVLKKTQPAIELAPFRSQTAPYYFAKGEIYRVLYEDSYKESYLDEAIAAFRKSLTLEAHPKTLFRLNYVLFEKQKIASEKLRLVKRDSLENTLNGMWQALLDFEEIRGWSENVWQPTDNEDLLLFLEKDIEAGLLSPAPNAYLSKIFNVCRRGKAINDEVLVNQWVEIEKKMRFDGYNLPCAGNFYLAHKTALAAIRENSDFLYRKALDYYRTAVDTAQFNLTKAIIYREMAHFVNSPPFYNLYEAVDYAGLAFDNNRYSLEYAEEYGEMLLALAKDIIRSEIAGKETFSAKVLKALSYAQLATQFDWSGRISAIFQCSVYNEWLQEPRDEQQLYLHQAKSLIVKAFEEQPDKTNPVILNQLIRVHKKFGAQGIRELRALTEKYGLLLTEKDILEEEIVSPNKVELLLNQLEDLKAELYEITLDNYIKFVDIKTKAAQLTEYEKRTSAYEKLMAELRQTKSLLDDLFTKKVDVLYKIGYSRYEEEEIKQLSDKILEDKVLLVSEDTRTKIYQISLPFRGLY
ncbi:MAG: hypothetical protein ONB05_10230, partial [candidate division KSB1 bacterium]|nr:hypothetical protein [candidate division KSB1 bacterium]